MSIIIKQRNLLLPGTIKVCNRIGNKIISTNRIRFKDFNMNGAIHSINLEEKQFTNFVKSYDKKIYLELKQIFDDIVLKHAKLDEKFVLLDNDKQNQEKKQRLHEIIQENINVNKVPELMKLQPRISKDDKTLDEVRVYVYYDKNIEEFNLFLIDLYHLGIDAFNYNIGKYDLEGRYKAYSQNKKCISKIADDYA